MLAAWYFISLTVSYISLFLMIATIYDLTLILKNPFQNAESRVNRHLIMAIIAATMFSSLGLWLTTLKHSVYAEFNTVLY
jgi:hypothetical protein